MSLDKYKRYIDSNGKCVLPDSFKEIEMRAFYDCKELKSITIPDSVTSIGVWAFYNCKKLESITIPDSVTSIGAGAFYECSNNLKINYNKKIGDYVFKSPSTLTSVTIPDSVTSIGNNAFSNCHSLWSITIPGSVTSIEARAFSCCERLSSIIIPDSVTSIGERAFYNCKSLKSITIPDSVTSIGAGAFYNCPAKRRINYNKKIGDYVFEDPSILTSVTIPDGVTSIGGDVFSGCKKLEYITILDSVTSIGAGAFTDCCNLKKIICPKRFRNLFPENCTYEFACIEDLKTETEAKLETEAKARAETEKMLKAQITAVEERFKAVAEELKKTAAANDDTEKMLKTQIMAVDNFNAAAMRMATTEKNIKAEIEQIKAESSRKIALTEAKAKAEAEKMLKDQITAIEERFKAVTEKLEKVTAAKEETEEKLKDQIAAEKSEASAEDKELINEYNASKAVGAFDRNVLKYEHEHCEKNMALVCRVPEWAKHIESETATAEDTWLKKLIIGKNVSEIYSDAFNGCPNLDGVDFSEAVALQIIEKDAFAGCDKLRRVNIPVNCEVEDGAFPEKCRVKRANTKSTNVSCSLAAPVVTQSMRERMGHNSLNESIAFGNDILKEEISIIPKKEYKQTSMVTSPLRDSYIKGEHGDNVM